MRGVSAFPPGFGEDMALMFAGSAATAADRVASGSADAWPPHAVPADRPADAVTSLDDRSGLPATDGASPDASPDAMSDGGPRGGWKQTIRLGQRGFYLRSATEEEEATAEEREPIGILIPTAIVGAILVASTYYLGIPI